MIADQHNHIPPGSRAERRLAKGGILFHQYFEKLRVLRGIESGDFQKHLDSFAQEFGVVGFAREHALAVALGLGAGWAQSRWTPRWPF